MEVGVAVVRIRDIHAIRWLISVCTRTWSIDCFTTVRMSINEVYTSFFISLDGTVQIGSVSNCTEEIQ